MPGADHPPAYIVVLAVPSLLGFDSIRDHMLASCLIGTGTVALIGLLGRRIAGDAAGLVAAGLPPSTPTCGSTTAPSCPRRWPCSSGWW